MHRIIALLISILLVSDCYGQLLVSTIDKRNGLPSNYIFDIEIDINGYVWVGTDKGLCRFNGQSWTVWNSQNGLPGNYINQILSDSLGGLYLSIAEKGIFYLPSGHQQIIPIIHIGDQFGEIYAVKENIFLLTCRDLIYSRYIHFNPKSQQIVYSRPKKKYGLQYLKANKSLENIKINKKFIGFNLDRIYEIQSNNLIQFPQNIFRSSTNSDQLIKSGSDYYYTSFDHGIAKIDSATKRVSYIKLLNGLPKIKISNILKDKNGQLLISTFGNGILVVKETEDIDIPLPNGVNNTIHAHNGSLFFNSGDKVYQYKHQSSRKLPQDIPNTTFIPFKDQIFLANFDGLYQSQIENKSTDQLLKITAGISSINTFQGKVMVSTYGSGIYYTENGNSFILSYPFNNIEKMYLLDNRQFVICSYEDGFCLLDSSLMLIKHFDLQSGLAYSEVRHAQFNLDTIWICNKNNLVGINKQKIVKSIPCISNSRNETMLYSFFYRNRLYAVTNRQLLVYDKEFMRPVKSFYLDSKVHLEITNAFYHRDNLYLSTEDKILVRNMQQFTTRVLPNPPKLNFGVTQVDTFHQLLNRELSYPFNLLELYFGSLSSDLANNTYIWFKIDNSDWQKGTDSNTIRLQNLSSGTHKLYTKAIDQNGLEYESQEIGFSVQYPWYYRWWAIGLGILILIFLITQIVQYLNRQRYQKKIQALTLQQELESERRRISRDLHDNMGAYTSALIANVDQLNHQYGETEQNRKMKSNAESILSSLRETIWVLNNKQISIEEFNDNFKNYCFKILRNFEQINFEAKEEISSNIEMKSIQALHLNKIMQEAIQNSIKHSQATEIIYQIKSNKNISILIQDNGIGFNKSERSSGYGMENMQWRATEANLELIIESQPMQGTIVKINTLK